MSDKKEQKVPVVFLLITYHLSLITYHFLDPPLTNGLVENDSGGDRDVERFDAAEERDAYVYVAALAHESPEPLALAAEEYRARLRPVPLGVILRRVGRGADSPHAAPLQLFHQPHDVRRARDRDVFERARRGLRDRLGQARRAPLGDEDAVRARALDRAYDGPEVARVF